MIKIFLLLKSSAFDHMYLRRVCEREAALESALKMLQQFYLDLEKFLAWLTEAETTANVLQDATHKEKILEDAKKVRELMKQWQVSQHFILEACHVSKVVRCFPVCNYSRKLKLFWKRELVLVLTFKCCFEIVAGN